MADTIVGFIVFICELLTANRKTAPYALVLMVLILIGATVFCFIGA